MEQLKYVIFNFNEVDKINFDEVMETSENTLRKSVNEELTFVKYVGEMPNSVQTLSTKTNEYNNFEMLNILETNEWKHVTNLEK